MKPAAIVTFGRLWSLSILFALIAAWITRARVQASLEANPQTVPIAVWALPGLTAVLTLVSLLLWYMVGRRSRTAKWLVLLMTAGSAARGAIALFNLIVGGFRHPVAPAVVMVGSALAVAAAAMLFREDARRWFGEDEVDEVDELPAFDAE